MVLLGASLFIVTVVAYVDVREGTLNRIQVNDEGFSIFSYRYNEPGAKISGWVDRMLGATAVHQELGNFTYRPTIGDQITFRAGNRATIAVPSLCSFELLGYARLSRKQQDRPFRIHDRARLNTGNATISIPHDGIQWNCSYRSIVEGWRGDRQSLYNPIFFYCPAPSAANCTERKAVENSNMPTGFIKMALFGAHHGIESSWSASFAVNHHAPKIRVESLKLQKKTTTAPLAACLVIPYVTSVKKKREANRALLYEWIRHHTSLGIKLIIYDRDAANRDAIYNSSYGRATGGSAINLSQVVYHPWTVAALHEKNQRSDGVDHNENGTMGFTVGKVDRLNRNGNDKMLTLSYCRFEASAVYGIENVVVMDSDEFFFCQNGAPSYTAQKVQLNNLIRKHEKLHTEELSQLPYATALQTHGGKYKFAAECVLDKINNSSSIFECFAAAKYWIKSFGMGKSMQLGYNCPITDYHTACRNNCVCKTVGPLRIADKTEVCNFLHLSLDEFTYIEARIMDKVTVKKYEDSKSELWYMSQGTSAQ